MDWELVESRRRPRGSRHRVVAYLGELSAGERAGGARLTTVLDGRDLLRGNEQVPWALKARILTVARFVEPESELHVEDTWHRRTVLPGLLGVGEAAVNDSRPYRTPGVVLPLKSMIQAHLKERAGQWFTTSLDPLLHDVASTCFEGLAAAWNALAARGRSRDGRPDPGQRALLDRLALVLPELLGRSKWPGPTQQLDRPCSLDSWSGGPRILDSRPCGF